MPVSDDSGLVLLCQLKKRVVVYKLHCAPEEQGGAFLQEIFSQKFTDYCIAVKCVEDTRLLVLSAHNQFHTTIINTSAEQWIPGCFSSVQCEENCIL